MLNFLDYAADLAEKVDPHRVSPNPRVGCVIVKDGKIVAEGVHAFFGGDHAEKKAIESFLNSGISSQNCEVYTTLEPCDSFLGKKTPSCTEQLLSFCPQKIVVGVLDPRFNGENLVKFKTAGIVVEIRENENCKKLNPFFEKWITQKKPYICLKIAQSLEGKITNLSDNSAKEKYITHDFSRKKVHEMRSIFSAILTTTETIFRDNPLLDCRLKDFPPNDKKDLFLQRAISSPQIIVLGKRKIPKTANIFLIPDRKIHFLENLEDLIEFCQKYGIDSILTECGAEMNTQLLAKNWVDEIQFFIAPKIFGKGKNAFSHEIPDEIFRNFQQESIESLSGDLQIQYLKNHNC